MATQKLISRVLCFVVMLLGVVLFSAGELAFAANPAPTPSPSPTVFEQSSPSSQALGQALGGSFQTGVSAAPSGTQQVFSQVLLDILGVGLQALSALNEPANTIDGTTYTEVYSFGKRVFSQSASFNTGNLGFTAGLAPTEVRVPLFVYPIGPLSVNIDGGVRFQADITGQLTPNIAVPATLSSIAAQLSAVADGAGFIEGDVSLLAVRAGVGGQVNLVDAQANLNAQIMADLSSPPSVSINGMVDFLSGSFYAFLDYFDLLTFSFNRLLDYTLYSWNGYCYSTGTISCP